MSNDLIKFPALGEGRKDWYDSGEGGQFFYAVWNTGQHAECAVDVEPTLHMADVMLEAHGPEAEAFEDQKRRWYVGSNSGDYERAWADSRIGFDTVIQLGTTGISYTRDGDYFTIKSVDDLTEKGRAIIEAVSAAMGSEPTFVSYLDT